METAQLEAKEFRRALGKLEGLVRFGVLEGQLTDLRPGAIGGRPDRDLDVLGVDGRPVGRALHLVGGGRHRDHPGRG